MEENIGAGPSPKHILEVGMAFWSSKILLSAVNLGLFTLLAKNPKSSAKEIRDALDLKCSERHAYDYLDCLAAMGFLLRDGLLETAKYSNTRDTDLFLDKAKKSYVGGILQFSNNSIYEEWGSLQASLKTGKPQRKESKSGNGGVDFLQLYKNAQQMKEFVSAMSGIQAVSFGTFAKKFDFSQYKTLIDAGGSGGDLSIAVARQNKHMKCISLDLEPVEFIAKENIEKHAIGSQVSTAVGDFFKDPLPKGDVVVMGNILHDWGMDKKKHLIASAYEALNPGGAFVVIEDIIDNERSKNVFGMQMSLNMLVETADGFNFTFCEFEGWAKEAGFSKTAMIPIVGPTSAAIAYK